MSKKTKKKKITFNELMLQIEKNQFGNSKLSDDAIIKRGIAKLERKLKVVFLDNSNLYMVNESYDEKRNKTSKDIENLYEERDKILAVFWYTIALYSAIIKEKKPKLMQKYNDTYYNILKSFQECSHCVDKDYRRKKLLETYYAEKSNKYLIDLYDLIRTSGEPYGIPEKMKRLEPYILYLIEKDAKIKTLYEATEKLIEIYDGLIIEHHKWIIDPPVTTTTDFEISSEEEEFIKMIMSTIPDARTAIYKRLEQGYWEDLDINTRKDIYEGVEELATEFKTIKRYMCVENDADVEKRVKLILKRLAVPLETRVLHLIDDIRDIVESEHVFEEDMKFCEKIFQKYMKD